MVRVGDTEISQRETVDVRPEGVGVQRHEVVVAVVEHPYLTPGQARQLLAELTEVVRILS